MEHRDKSGRSSSSPTTNLTPEEAIQGGDRNLERVVQNSKLSTADNVVRGAKHVLGVFFPWMQPNSAD